MLEKHRTAVSINTRARRLGCKERKRATTASKSLEDARESGGHYRIAAHLRRRRNSSIGVAQHLFVCAESRRTPSVHPASSASSGHPRTRPWTCSFKRLHQS